MNTVLSLPKHLFSFHLKWFYTAAGKFQKPDISTYKQPRTLLKGKRNINHFVHCWHTYKSTYKNKLQAKSSWSVPWNPAHLDNNETWHSTTEKRMLNQTDADMSCKLWIHDRNLKACSTPNITSTSTLYHIERKKNISKGVLKPLWPSK